MRLIGLLALSLLLAGCGGREFTATPGSEIPPGPGLFTGADGELVVTPGGIR